MIIVLHDLDDTRRRIALDSKRIVSIVEKKPEDDKPAGAYIIVDGGFKGAVEETFDEILEKISNK